MRPLHLQRRSTRWSVSGRAEVIHRSGRRLDDGSWETVESPPVAIRCVASPMGAGRERSLEGQDAPRIGSQMEFHIGDERVSLTPDADVIVWNGERYRIASVSTYDSRHMVALGTTEDPQG